MWGACRWSRRMRTVQSIVLACGIAACHDVSAPRPIPVARDLQTTTESPDYYVYRGEKIFLAEDPKSIIVESADDPAAIRTEVAQQLGSSVDSVVAMPSMRGHQRVYLSDAIAGRVATRVEQLRTAVPRFKFISPIYKTLDGHLYVPLDRIIARFKAGVDETAVRSFADSLGLRIERPVQPDSGHVAYWLTSVTGRSVNVLAAAQSLAADARVVWAEPDNISDEHIDAVPNDPYLTYQFYLKNSYVYPSTGVAVDINVEPAWGLTTGSSSITVAVIDEGVQAGHPDLAGRVIAGHDEFPGYSGEDGLHPCLSCTGDGVLGDPHGTAVAGIIAADQNNSAGVSGVAPAVNLVSARIFRNHVPASAAQIADAITWAYSTENADVISNSWSGGTPSSAVDNAISSAVTSGRGGKGAVLVFATGNDAMSSLAWPASDANSMNIIAVGAITDQGPLAYYSNYGTGLSVVAPSSGGYAGVTTTDLLGPSEGYNSGPDANGDYTSTFGGTSAATPQVSGIAALLLSREPTLRANDVWTRVVQGADPWGDATHYGRGKANAYRTLVQPAVVINGVTHVRTAGSYTFQSVVSGGVGPFNYDWERDDGYGFYQVATTRNYTTVISSGDPSFRLQLNVTAGGYVTTALQVVTNLIP